MPGQCLLCTQVMEAYEERGRRRLGGGEIHEDMERVYTGREAWSGASGREGRTSERKEVRTHDGWRGGTALVGRARAPPPFRPEPVGAAEADGQCTRCLRCPNRRNSPHPASLHSSVSWVSSVWSVSSVSSVTSVSTVTSDSSVSSVSSISSITSVRSHGIRRFRRLRRFSSISSILLPHREPPHCVFDPFRQSGALSRLLAPALACPRLFAPFRCRRIELQLAVSVAGVLPR